MQLNQNLKNQAVKKFGILIGIICLLAKGYGQSHELKVPAVIIKTLNGSSFNTENISNDGKPILICFWATWCSSSLSKLDTYQEVYGDWKKETGVKIITVSIDDSRTFMNVKTTISLHDWEFEHFTDLNQDLKRALNANACPYELLIDNKGIIVWQNSGYIAGEEEQVYEFIKKLAKGEKLSEQ